MAVQELSGSDGTDILCLGLTPESAAKVAGSVEENRARPSRTEGMVSDNVEETKRLLD
jgi:hypothetical protein